MSRKTAHTGEWGSKIGLILAMAGNAVGLGNFWRLPRMVAEYGGGAFMIPYFAALFVVGIPIALMEWHLGRFGGQHGQGTIGPMIYLQARHRIRPKGAMVLGTIAGGLAFCIPVLINSYYNHIVGWSITYAIESLFGQLSNGTNLEEVYTNTISHWLPAVGGWIFVMALLAIVASLGIKKGIEAWSKIMMPLLYVFGILLVVAALTAPARPETPDLTPIAGLNFLWNPDFSKINWQVVLAACGQIFFTLSLGMGLISNYSSYLKKDDDIVVSAITTISLNEVAEITIASTAVVPLAYVFMGNDLTQGGSVGFSFISMPNAFANMPFGNIVGAIWFFLFFFAGFTSALALFNYLVTFIQEGLIKSRAASSWIAFVILVVLGIPVVLEPILTGGQQVYFDTVDSWVGSYLVLFLGFVELIVVGWLCPADQTLQGINRGSYMKIPRWIVTVFIRFITPLVLAIVIVNASIYQVQNNYLALDGGVNGDIVWSNVGRLMILFVLVIGLIIAGMQIRRDYANDLHPKHSKKQEVLSK